MNPKYFALPALMLLGGCASDQIDKTEQTPLHLGVDVKHAPHVSREPTLPGNGWDLVWQDEFSGTEIDSTKWSHEVNCWGGGNNEQQCYVKDKKNSFVKDGVLTIRAQQRKTTGRNQLEGVAGAEIVTLPYASARLRTIHKGDWKYGRFEIRAKLPKGQGTWPAIWMLPTDQVYGGWAGSGEIDIVESVNLGADYITNGQTKEENRIHGTLHYGKAWPSNVQSGVSYNFGSEQISPADQFYTYAIEWEKDEIRWYVDDVHYATQRSDGWWSQYQDEDKKWISGYEDAPYNQRFHIILNVAMGGNWPASVNEKGIDKSIKQADMQVDFVRVYQCSVDPKTGKGCSSERSKLAIHHPGTKEPILPYKMDFSSSSLMLHKKNLNKDVDFAGWDNVGNDKLSVSEKGLHVEINGVGNSYLSFKAGPQDMTKFYRGVVSFDLTRTGGDSEGLMVKMDSGHPAVAPIVIPGDQLPQIGETRKYTLKVKDFVAAGVNNFTLKRIVNPIVFEPINSDSLSFTVSNLEFAKKTSN